VPHLVLLQLLVALDNVLEMGELPHVHQGSVLKNKNYLNPDVKFKEPAPLRGQCHKFFDFACFVKLSPPRALILGLSRCEYCF
jgi:hypothetical protein